MSYLSTRGFWAGAAECAVKTFAQATIAALTAAQASGPLGPTNTPSLTSSEPS